MIEGSSRPAPRRISRHLMVGGLGFWGVSAGGAIVPSVLRAMFYPNHADARPFDLLTTDPLGAPFLWSMFALWAVSWAFVVGYAAAAWAARDASHPWVRHVHLLLSLVSPLVFTFAVSVVLPLATRGAYHGSGVVPFLPAVVVQLVISQTYAFVTGSRPRARVQHAEGA
jgi:hypothetical protein